MRLLVERRTEALADLYDRYSGMLLALASRILNSPADGEEVLQEVLLQVWNQASSYNPSRSSVSTWLVLLTRSRAIDRMRRRRVGERAAIALQQENPSPHASSQAVQDVLFRERRQRVQTQMEALPAEQRQVLEMAFYGGLTQPEIAARTGVPLGTVKTRTLLAMKKLRTALRDEIRELL